MKPLDHFAFGVSSFVRHRIRRAMESVTIGSVPSVWPESTDRVRHAGTDGAPEAHELESLFVSVRPRVKNA